MYNSIKSLQLSCKIQSKHDSYHVQLKTQQLSCRIQSKYNSCHTYIYFNNSKYDHCSACWHVQFKTQEASRITEIENYSIKEIFLYNSGLGCTYFQRYGNKRLTSSILSTNTTTLKECIRTCGETPGCLAAYVTKGNGAVTCFLTTGLSNESEMETDDRYDLFVSSTC